MKSMLFALFDIYPDFYSFFSYRDIVMLHNVSIKLRAKMKIIITMLKAKYYNCDYCHYTEVNPLLL